MEIVKVVLDVLKTLFSGISTFVGLNKKKKGDVVISDNKRTKIQGNISENNKIKIEKNTDTDIKDNKWK